MRGILVVLILILNVQSWGQSEFRYDNSILIKALTKEGISDFSDISEIPLADSLKQKYRLQGEFYEINLDISRYKYIYAGRVNSCRNGGCSISVQTLKEGASEYFDYFILFDQNKTVQLVKVFNYQATHGHEITAKGWLKQFIGYNGSESLQVDKNIDTISGATISVNAITFDVEMKTEILKSL